MRNNSVFVAMLLGMSFASNAKVTKSLKKIKEGGEVDDATLAAECKTTKAYKEDLGPGFTGIVDQILSASLGSNQPTKEPAVAKTTRSGEPRW